LLSGLVGAGALVLSGCAPLPVAPAARLFGLEVPQAADLATA
jgi:hypothetical protein